MHTTCTPHVRILSRKLLLHASLSLSRQKQAATKCVPKKVRSHLPVKVAGAKLNLNMYTTAALRSSMMLVDYDCTAFSTLRRSMHLARYDKATSAGERSVPFFLHSNTKKSHCHTNEMQHLHDHAFRAQSSSCQCKSACRPGAVI